ncbi:hypothetical protein ACLKMY_27015 [Paraburkholderia mimosarum]|uniref:hypothetical protein n=1 Tax=Paraburkholderia mimosarum TaxID=312026 RepID=UPI0039C2881C
MFIRERRQLEYQNYTASRMTGQFTQCRDSTRHNVAYATSIGNPATRFSQPNSISRFVFEHRPKHRHARAKPIKFFIDRYFVLPSATELLKGAPKVHGHGPFMVEAHILFIRNDSLFAILITRHDRVSRLRR